jgi:hypothetical protein
MPPTERHGFWMIGKMAGELGDPAAVTSVLSER